jgi:preprotein translocase subunit YajC
MFHFNLLPLAGTSSAAAATTSSTSSLLSMVAMFAIVIVVFYFLLIRPQRKKDKQTQKMRSAIQVGDEVTTVGGIMGRIVSIKDDMIIIETGADRSKIRIKKWAIQSCDTIHENIQ